MAVDAACSFPTKSSRWLAAPVAVARAAGLFTSRVDGSELIYNQDDVMLPDLVIARPELAEMILSFIRRHGTD